MFEILLFIFLESSAHPTLCSGYRYLSLSIPPSLCLSVSLRITRKEEEKKEHPLLVPPPPQTKKGPRLQPILLHPAPPFPGPPFTKNVRTSGRGTLLFAERMNIVFVGSPPFYLCGEHPVNEAYIYLERYTFLGPTTL